MRHEFASHELLKRVFNMKRNEWVKKGLIGIGISLVLCAMGCSEGMDKKMEVEPDLPRALSLLQGKWITVTTNGFTKNCGVLIDQYTVRIHYQNTPESPMERQSSIISRVDEEKHFLITKDGRGGWPYFYGREDGEEHLELEFFSELKGAWQRLYLRRAAIL
jgi:hypothetical protein